MKNAAGDVNFGIDFSQQAGKLTAALLNGTDRQPFTGAAWDGKVLTLKFDFYDGTLTAHFISPQQNGGRVLAADEPRDCPHSFEPSPLLLAPFRAAVERS